MVNSSSSGNESSSRPTIRAAQRRQPAPQPTDSGPVTEPLHTQQASRSFDEPLPSRRELRRREAEASGGAPSYSDAPDDSGAPTEALPLQQAPYAGAGAAAGAGVAAGQYTADQYTAPQYSTAQNTAPQYASAQPQYTSAQYASAPATAAQPAAAESDPHLGGGGNGGRGNGGGRKPKPQRQPLGPIRGTIRTFGELCITAGLVLILFVVWQLWWTDIEANRDNEVLADQLTKDWANQDPNKLPADPKEPVVAEPVEKNTAFGIFYIPRFGDDYYRTLAEGVDLEPVLNRMGVGRYPNSAMPGEVGNFSVAGHRVTYGKPFNQIAKLQPGDEIVVQTKDGFYTYTFRNFDIILPDAVEVLAPVPDQPEYKGKDRILTLTACNPMFSARERYIAYAELTEWRPAADGPPEAIKDSKAYDKVSKNGGA
ncbi:class E sortase [Brevibacterium metallidurans]|uniref:Class E sortase n=1 Tax=Brevibacterium metallidurans TaxID=1482676 RepID=A0ABP3C358_9MICO